MMLWELYICFGLTWAGCAGSHVTSYPNEAACYRALDSMVRDDKRVVAYCRPKQDKP
jgi:hypothetical protein